MNTISKQNEYLIVKPIGWGLGGIAILMSFYMLVLSFSMGLSYAWESFIGLWTWMVPLVLGCGHEL